MHANITPPIKRATNAIHAESSVTFSNVTSNDASFEDNQQMFSMPIDEILRRS